jgi:hypothetical protein
MINPPVSGVRRRKSRRWLWLTAIVIVAVALIGAGAGYFTGDGGDTPPLSTAPAKDVDSGDASGTSSSGGANVPVGGTTVEKERPDEAAALLAAGYVPVGRKKSPDEAAALLAAGFYTLENALSSGVDPLQLSVWRADRVYVAPLATVDVVDLLEAMGLVEKVLVTDDVLERAMRRAFEAWIETTYTDGPPLFISLARRVQFGEWATTVLEGGTGWTLEDDVAYQIPSGGKPARKKSLSEGAAREVSVAAAPSVGGGAAGGGSTPPPTGSGGDDPAIPGGSTGGGGSGGSSPPSAPPEVVNPTTFVVGTTYTLTFTTAAGAAESGVVDGRVQYQIPFLPPRGAKRIELWVLDGGGHAHFRPGRGEGGSASPPNVGKGKLVFSLPTFDADDPLVLFGEQGVRIGVLFYNK